MKRISDERRRIDAYRFDLGAAGFFNDRSKKEDWEWLILSYLSDILTFVGWQSPEYAEKLAPPAPDFRTYLPDKSTHREVEVTEVIGPDYPRNAFHRDLSAHAVTAYTPRKPHPKPWSTFLHVLREKLAKSYSAKTWLLIYHDMPESEFNDKYPTWHERVLGELRTWRYDSPETCDITCSQYESIFVIECSGQAAVRLHPHWDIIRPSTLDS